jgi:hypothetical protein
MGSEYISTPIEIVKYIKIKDRRLISGFLTINIVSHNDNDLYDDAQEYHHTNWGSLSANIKNATPFYGVQPQDPGRAGYGHTFGDYDSLLFFVAGGMTLLDGGASMDGPAKTSGYLSALNYEDTTDGIWYDSFTHPCQHFLKSHLISRINNGYGHTNALYSKVDPIRADTFEADGGDSADLVNNDLGDPTAYANNRGGQWSKYVFSNGIFSNDNDGDFITDLSVDTNNTYFPQVQGVEIYGKHNYEIPTNTGDGGTLYTNNALKGYTHQADYWSMVIKIKMRGYDSTSPTSNPSQADTEFFKSRTNVFFQPFGETASFDIADSLHT